MTERWAQLPRTLVPSHTGDEITTVAPGPQLLLTSKDPRPPTGRRACDAEKVLVGMALASLDH